MPELHHSEVSVALLQIETRLSYNPFIARLQIGQIFHLPPQPTKAVERDQAEANLSLDTDPVSQHIPSFSSCSNKLTTSIQEETRGRPSERKGTAPRQRRDSSSPMYRIGDRRSGQALDGWDGLKRQLDFINGVRQPLADLPVSPPSGTPQPTPSVMRRQVTPAARPLQMPMPRRPITEARAQFILADMENKAREVLRLRQELGEVMNAVGVANARNAETKARMDELERRRKVAEYAKRLVEEAHKAEEKRAAMDADEVAPSSDFVAGGEAVDDQPVASGSGLVRK